MNQLLLKRIAVSPEKHQEYCSNVQELTGLQFKNVQNLNPWADAPSKIHIIVSPWKYHCNKQIWESENGVANDWVTTHLSPIQFNPDGE